MAGCFCLGRPPSPAADALKSKAAPSELPLKVAKHQIQAQDSKPADVLIGAVKAAEAEALAEAPVSFEQQHEPAETSIEAAAVDLGPLRESAALDASESSADDKGKLAGPLADRPASEAAATENAAAARSKEGATVTADGKTAGQTGAGRDTAAPDSLGVAASLASQPRIDSVQRGQEGPLFAGQTSAEAAGTQSEVADQPLYHARPEVGARQAEANVGRTAHSDANLDHGNCLQQEDSSAALLPASEVLLKQPLISQLSALLSCSGTSPGSGNEEKRSKQKTPKVPLLESQRLQLDFECAAAELALLPRSKLLPLPHPTRALADAAGMLGGQDAPTLLAALLTLRRVAIHHPGLLAGSLADLAALLAECMHGRDAALAQAAVLVLLDLLLCHGAAMLSHCEQAGDPQRSCLLGLLLAASTGCTPAIRHWANEALRFVAEQLPRGRVVRMLEPYLEHPQGPVRAKAAEWLMVATYRPAERGGRGSPRGSPGLHKPGWKD